MNFIKASISCRYLYSPISWLHRQNETIKFYIIIAVLAYLPIAPLKSILYIFIITILLLKSIKAPKYIARYFYENFILFIFFMAASTKHSNQYKLNNSEKRPIWKIYLNWNYNIANLSKRSNEEKFFFYMPISLARLIIINLIHVVLTKCFLLTTKDASVIHLVLGKIVSNYMANTRKLIFTTTVSPQFIEIIFEEIKAIKISISIRDYESDYMSMTQGKMHKAALLFQYFLHSIDNAIHNTAETLYARDIRA